MAGRSAVAIRAPRVRALVALLGELHELVAAGDDPTGHVAEGGARLVGCDVGMSVTGAPGMAVGDNLSKIVCAGLSPAQVREIDTLYTVDRGASADPLALASLARWPKAIMGRRRDLVDDATWYGSTYVNERRRAWRLDDSIYTSAASSDGAMRGTGFFRTWGSRPFTSEDRELACLLVEHTLELLPRIVKTRLSPRERETKRHLLTGASTKEIAARLGLSVHTVNEYVQGIYRAENVHSRAELLARYRR